MHVDQAVFILEKVHIIWEPLLMPSAYRRSMCVVLDSVFSRITRDILLIDDMAAEETVQVDVNISHSISKHSTLGNLIDLMPSFFFIAIASKTNPADVGEPIFSLGIP